jgi:hypothetical protein
LDYKPFNQYEYMRIIKTWQDDKIDELRGKHKQILVTILAACNYVCIRFLALMHPHVLYIYIYGLGLLLC